MSAAPPLDPLPHAGGEDAIALALGGGAALGWAHIGVLRVLAEEGIAVGAVAGTSIGAIAAICLAADRLDVLEGIATGATRRHVFGYLDPHLGRGALLGGRGIARRLREHLGDVRLEALRMPVSIVAADIDRSEEVRLTVGPAIAAVQASIALPGLFRPVAIDGRLLVDGGMVACVPLAAARAIAPALPLVAVSLLDAAARPG
ncbi:patatin-like phospholipase family protein, partial [Sphingomonas bacterium]|uniref:patatin-like phospholipase family protein n=1 Tax=Sphingomonas bacterium TaxID=1895847 RepID=UPI001574F2AC